MNADKALGLKRVAPSGAFTWKVKDGAAHNFLRICVHLRESAVELLFPG